MPLVDDAADVRLRGLDQRRGLAGHGDLFGAARRAQFRVEGDARQHVDRDRVGGVAGKALGFDFDAIVARHHLC